MTDLSRRPADARRRRDRRREAADARRGADHPQDPGASDLLRRRVEDHGARCRARSSPASERGGLAIAYHWGGTDAVKVHLAVKSDWSLKPVYDVIATIRGSDLSRPVDRPRQPPRRLGDGRGRSADRPGRDDERGQGAGRALPPGLAARRGPSSTPAGTARSRGCSARPNGPRPMPTSSSARRVLYINTDNNGRGYPLRAGQWRAPAFRQPGRERRRRPADRRPGRRARPRGDLAGHYLDTDATSGPSRRRRQGRRRPAARPARLGLGLFGLRPASRDPVAQPRLRRRGLRRAAATTRSTTASITSCTSTIPGLAYGAALSKVVGRLVLRAADAPRVPAHYSRLRRRRVALPRPRSRSSPPTSARRTARSPTSAARATSSSPPRPTTRPSLRPTRASRR